MNVGTQLAVREVRVPADVIGVQVRVHDGVDRVRARSPPSAKRSRNGHVRSLQYGTASFLPLPTQGSTEQHAPAVLDHERLHAQRDLAARVGEVRNEPRVAGDVGGAASGKNISGGMPVTSSSRTLVMVLPPTVQRCVLIVVRSSRRAPHGH